MRPRQPLSASTTRSDWYSTALACSSRIPAARPRPRPPATSSEPTCVAGQFPCLAPALNLLPVDQRRRARSRRLRFALPMRSNAAAQLPLPPRPSGASSWPVTASPLLAQWPNVSIALVLPLYSAQQCTRFGPRGVFFCRTF
ncbi:hypothetical protein VPH35_044287 [Triticum aestivum]